MTAPRKQATGRRPGARRALLVLAGTFLLGALFGASGLLLSARAVLLFGAKTGVGVSRIVAQYDGELDLTPEQRRQVAEIIDRTRVDSFRRSGATTQYLRARADQARAEIREILTPEQQRRFDDFVPRAERRYRKALETSERLTETVLSD